MGIKSNDRRRGRWSVAGVTAALGLLFLMSDSEPMQSVFPVGRRLSEWSYDWPFAWRGHIALSNVVILYMDRPSHQRLGQKDFAHWDRDLHARLLRRLKEWGARVVAFDVFFDESGATPGDEALVQAVRAHGRVVVAALRKLVLSPSGTPIGYRLEEPFLGLLEVAQWGLPEAAYEDRTVREQMRDVGLPSLAWQTARLAGGRPTDPDTPRWINYYGPPGWLPHHSYADVLESERDWTEVFTNRVVFVGALWDVAFTGGKGTDDFRTPYTRVRGQMSPGVEVTATAYLNLVRGDWLRRFPPWTEALIVVGLGFLLGHGLMGRGPWIVMSVGLAAAVFVLAVSLWLVWGWHIWFPWLIPVAIQIPAAMVGVLVGRMLELLRERRALERELIWAGGPEVPSPPAPAAMPAPATAPGAAVSPTSPQAGPIAVPNHTLLRKFAEGGYGELWLGQDILGQFHAVKIVRRDSFRDATPFEREFGGIKRFTPISRTHPGFIAILHVGREPDYLYYIMELGDDMETGPCIDPDHYTPRTLEREIKRRGRVPLELCLEWGLALASALEHLHAAGFIHRDLKPANVVFVQGKPKIADIGLVTEAAGPGETTTYLGSKGFIAPEGPGTASADVFSLGKILYEAAYGTKADQFPEVPAAVMAQMDETIFFQWNRILLRACAAAAAQRYPTVQPLRTDLADLLAELRKR